MKIELKSQLTTQHNVLHDDDDDPEEVAQEEEEEEEFKLEMLQEQHLKSLHNNNDHGYELWNKLEQISSKLSSNLCEQLRIILEPQLATRLQGDYRTGKRINIKKIIPYIASQYRKDKIWMKTYQTYETYVSSYMCY